MNDKDFRYEKARKKVEMIKWFYIDIGLYVVINLSLFLLNILTTPDNLWFYWVMLAWGIGLTVHAVVVYGFSNVLGDEWEERKIREIMDKK
jgi:hypothetical protein